MDDELKDSELDAVCAGLQKEGRRVNYVPPVAKRVASPGGQSCGPTGCAA